MSRVMWCLRQLLPLTYRAYYGDEYGRVHFTVWKMWLGRSYKVTDVIVDTFSMTLNDTLYLLTELCAVASPSYAE